MIMGREHCMMNGQMLYRALLRMLVRAVMWVFLTWVLLT